MSVEIPIEMLDAATLRNLIEEFVTRDGTDLSEVEERIHAVQRHLKEGLAKIVFDPDSETSTVIPV